jgi:hypothetical protein
MKSKKLIIVIVVLFPILNIYGQSETLVSINDSTDARYRYESEEYYSAAIPSEADINDIDILEREELQPRHHITKICIGVNGSYEPYSQTINLKYTEMEEWMEAPYLQIHTPTNSYGFDSIGNQTYSFKNTSAENTSIEAEANFYSTEGFQPIIMFFPSKHDQFVQDAKNGGAIFTLYPDNSFKLTMSGDEMIIDPNNHSIVTDYTLDSMHYYSKIEYDLFAPYGYVPKYEITKSKRVDLPFPIIRTETTLFRNHVIEDITGIIQKYTDKAYIEVFPNPIEGRYEVLLQGIPKAQVSQVQIRDHMGNIIHTHTNPTVSNNLIELDGSSYPAGAIIIIVYTQHGIYTETLMKS